MILYSLDAKQSLTTFIKKCPHTSLVIIFNFVSIFLNCVKHTKASTSRQSLKLIKINACFNSRVFFYNYSIMNKIDFCFDILTNCIMHILSGPIFFYFKIIKSSFNRLGSALIRDFEKYTKTNESSFGMERKLGSNAVKPDLFRFWCRDYLQGISVSFTNRFRNHLKLNFKFIFSFIAIRIQVCIKCSKPSVV
jgi:hypothetical protein